MLWVFAVDLAAAHFDEPPLPGFMATKARGKKSAPGDSSERVRVNCSLSPDLVRLLDVLVETGAFGRTRPEVLERLATDRITKMWQDGDLSRDKLSALLITPDQVRAMKEPE